VVAWTDLARDPDALEGRLAGQDDLLLRIESPGESFAVYKLLLALGAEEPDDRFAAPRLSARKALALVEDRGRVCFPRQRFLGFRAALRRVSKTLRGRTGVRLMNAPDDIVTMSDKPACHEVFAIREVPVPELLGTPSSFDELTALMRARRVSQVFVKLANGSSAAGVVAFRAAPHGSRLQAITGVELASDGDGGTALYNSRRVRRYDAAADVRRLFDSLCTEGVIVERWIPKAGLDGRTFDLRVLVIGGCARHVVVRTSPTPITNLHLGRDNRRADVERLRDHIGARRLRAALDLAERASAVFPSSLYAGVDVLLTPGGARAFVVEINAFGDLLRRSRDRGQDPYEAELAA
jgi:glutathione synthase/RimK-type ligase-like ATP-grasp enzyme